jgi:glycosyltransferase involved in cell wall biosynthesis
VFGYAAALRADVALRPAALAVAPLALAAGWRRTRQVARVVGATIVHAHWVIPGGVIGAAAAGSRPLVISAHGSDVYVAERHRVARRAARAALARAAWVTACSTDLGARAVALGAPAAQTSIVPYGVDSARFKPDSTARARGRATLAVSDDIPVVFAFGRLVRKKGFEFLIDAASLLAREWPTLRIVIAGEGDLGLTLRAHAARCGLAERVQFLGVVPQDRIPAFLAAADVAVVPSVHDEAGNVDGLPNTVLEVMASATPLVATLVGGIDAVATDGETARLVPERDAQALAEAIDGLLRDAACRATLGRRAREAVCRNYDWSRVAEQFEEIYARVATDR